MARRRRAWERVWIGPALVVGVAAATLALDGKTGLVPLVDLWSEVSQLQDDVRDLEAERDALRERARALKTDPLEVEALAREDLGMVRPGEVVLRLTTPDPGD
jgi:cell division protein FtsB